MMEHERCDTFWGTHGCDLPAEHEVPCVCRLCHDSLVGTEDHVLCAGCPPYYGPSTSFFSNWGTPTPPQTLAAAQGKP